MNLRIGLDLDGTICNFDKHYYNRFNKHPSESIDWTVTRNVNYILKYDKSFWLTIPVLRKPNFIPACYCSVRVNNPRWTKDFLKRNDFPDAKLYQLKGGWGTSKYNILKNKVDVFIDDSIWNFEDLNSKGVKCLLITTDSNKDYNTPYRVNSLDINEINSVLNYAN